MWSARITNMTNESRNSDIAKQIRDLQRKIARRYAQRKLAGKYTLRKAA